MPALTTLGPHGPKISRICLGTMTWGHQNTEAQAHQQMDYALGEGINFWDTAELYAVPPTAETYGKTESYIGSWFAKTGQRDNVVLASKVAGPGRPYIRGGGPITAPGILAAIDGSLKRLRTDYIDLYQLHWPNRPYPHHQNHWSFTAKANEAKETEEMHAILQTLGELIQAGKIRTWGLSNDTPWGVMTYLRLAEKFSLPRLVSLQNEYSLLYRYDDGYMEEVCTYEKVAYLTYSSLAVGILTGKYQNGAMPEGSRIALSNGMSGRLTPGSVAATAEYLALARKHQIDPAQMALAFTLTRPFISSCIIGATSLEQLKTDIAAKDLTLGSEVLGEIEAIRRRHPMPF